MVRFLADRRHDEERNCAPTKNYKLRGAIHAGINLKEQNKKRSDGKN